jgi:hypothetical protein
MMASRVGKQSATDIIYDELFLQPWFLPKPTYLALRRLLPSSQMAKMSYYFEDYGCLKCGNRQALYASNGLCKRCSVIIRGRIVLALKRRFRKIGAKVDREIVERLLVQMKRA